MCFGLRREDDHRGDGSEGAASATADAVGPAAPAVAVAVAAAAAAVDAAAAAAEDAIHEGRCLLVVGGAVA